MAMVAQGEVNVVRNSINEDRAKDGLAKVTAALTEATELGAKIKSQLELIPEKNGKKDRLGTNVENYITEMQTSVDTEIVTPLEEVINSEAKIMKEARRLDDQDYNRRKIAAEKNKPVALVQ